MIGLAGTILITGIAPTMVTSLGAAAIPITFLATVSGWLLCMFLAELAAMMPDRSGGSHAYVAFKDRWAKFAGHLNGITAWGYWLGWFPVAPLNMILASFYLADLFKLNTTSGISLLGTNIAWWTIGIAALGIVLLFIPSYRGLRFGTVFATTLAMLSMIPLTFLAISWIFNPSVVDFSQLSHFRHTNGSGFFSPIYGHGWLTISIAFNVWGGPVYASCTCSQAGKSTLPYYFIGIATLLSYLPLYWYRKYVEDKRAAPPSAEHTSALAATGSSP